MFVRRIVKPSAAIESSSNLFTSAMTSVMSAGPSDVRSAIAAAIVRRHETRDRNFSVAGSGFTAWNKLLSNWLRRNQFLHRLRNELHPVEIARGCSLNLRHIDGMFAAECDCRFDRRLQIGDQLSLIANRSHSAPAGAVNRQSLLEYAKTFA